MNREAVCPVGARVGPETPDAVVREVYCHNRLDLAFGFECANLHRVVVQIPLAGDVDVCLVIGDRVLAPVAGEVRPAPEAVIPAESAAPVLRQPHEFIAGLARGRAHQQAGSFGWTRRPAHRGQEQHIRRRRMIGQPAPRAVDGLPRRRPGAIHGKLEAHADPVVDQAAHPNPARPHATAHQVSLRVVLTVVVAVPPEGALSRRKPNLGGEVANAPAFEILDHQSDHARPLQMQSDRYGGRMRRLRVFTPDGLTKPGRASRRKVAQRENNDHGSRDGLAGHRRVSSRTNDRSANPDHTIPRRVRSTHYHSTSTAGAGPSQIAEISSEFATHRTVRPRHQAMCRV